MSKAILILSMIHLSMIVWSQTISDFETLLSEQNTYLDGSDLSGGFQSGNIYLPNDYNLDWQSWIGWSISSMRDTISAGFQNQYSAISGIGYNGSNSYAVTYVAGESRVILIDAALGQIVNGMYVTNSTYAYKSMRNGDAFSKTFGGPTGNDPDYFLLTIKKWYNGILSDEKVDFYLADYRFTNNELDYIVEDWTFVDLKNLGKVDSLQFTLSSSDNGQFGMNTPAYFCMDDMTTSDGSTAIKNTVVDSEIKILQPVTNDITLLGLQGRPFQWKVFDLNGVMLGHGYSNSSTLPNLALKNGNYVLSVLVGDKAHYLKFIVVRE